MTPRTGRILVAACLCIAPGTDRDISAQAPPAARSTAVISGRILASDTGLPLRGARVAVYGSSHVMSGPRRATITDADGAFSFTELPAGRYRLEAAKARYVDGEFGARRPKPIEVAEGEKVDITVSLAPAGVIVGRVLDDLGEPVADARVEYLGAFAGPNGSRQLAAMGMSATTDDTGAYRLHGLSPGTYYVSAHDDNAMRYGSATTSPTPGFAPTFFPGTAAAAEAQPVQVVAGGEAVADITLVYAKLTVVSGVVVSAAGAPATGGSVNASPGPDMRGLGGRNADTVIEPDGTFVLPALAPGEYTVHARPTFEPGGRFASGSGLPTNLRSVSRSIVVTGEPVTGLRVVLPDPIRIPVAVTFEDATGRPPEASVGAYSERMGSDASSMRGADGRLTLELSPGPWRFSAHAAEPWMVKRLAYRGNELHDQEDVEVTDGTGGRLEVVFTTKSATAGGSVRDANGKPLADYILFMGTPTGDPSDPASYDTFTMTSPDQAGRFKAERLRAGTYLFFATDGAQRDEPGWTFAEFRERALKTGTLLRLREGETVTLELTPLP